MIGRLLNRLRRQPARPPAGTQRRKLFCQDRPQAVYAIGDVHGCHDLLRRLEDRIFETARDIEGPKWIIMLGDYIDRGPKSASVIDHLMAPVGHGFQRICLAGNHEDAFLDFIGNPVSSHAWLNFGGLETLRSYGISKVPARRDAMAALLESYVPGEHIDFLSRLPSLLACPGLCFAHAGLEPGTPLEDQTDETLLWRRPLASDPPIASDIGVLVHGHTPVTEIKMIGGRINVDTGAYMSGQLSAVRIDRNGSVSLMQTA